MQVKRLKDRVRLTLEGAVTVNRAADLRDALLKSLAQGDNIEVDCEQVTEVDLTFLQLMCSAHRSARAAKKVLTIVDREKSAIGDTVVRAGFNYQKSCGDDSMGDCLWVGGMKQ